MLRKVWRGLGPSDARCRGYDMRRGVSPNRATQAILKQAETKQPTGLRGRKCFPSAPLVACLNNRQVCFLNRFLIWVCLKINPDNPMYAYIAYIGRRQRFSTTLTDKPECSQFWGHSNRQLPTRVPTSLPTTSSPQFRRLYPTTPSNHPFPTPFRPLT